MIIVHSGDVAQIRDIGGATYITVQDRTTGIAIDVFMGGKHAEAATKLKLGQVVQATGWSNKIGPATLQYVYSVRALSGVSEKEVNDLDEQQGNAIRNLGTLTKAYEDIKALSDKRGELIKKLTEEIEALKRANYQSLLDQIAGVGE